MDNQLIWSYRLNTLVPEDHNSCSKTLIFPNWPTNACGGGRQFLFTKSTVKIAFPKSTLCYVAILFQRSWSPYPSLPPCQITHCPDLPTIPSSSNLEEVDNEWAEVGRSKRLRCKGFKDEINHTMFFESNRSKSEMLLECLENGTYAHVEEWPVCLQGFCKLEIVWTLFTKCKHG